MSVLVLSVFFVSGAKNESSANIVYKLVLNIHN